MQKIKNIENQEHLMTVGRVLKVNPLCWTKEEHMELMVDKDTGDYRRLFKDWCSVGDYVVYGKFAGLKLEVSGVKLIIINDDEVVARVNDPSTVRRFV